ncbi:MAG: hypothetical protein RMY62_010960 [Nostoc sp. ZfuVER08]|nr:hypothetical protein [Nostoc sp. ZfuVER08]
MLVFSLLTIAADLTLPEGMQLHEKRYKSLQRTIQNIYCDRQVMLD